MSISQGIITSTMENKHHMRSKFIWTWLGFANCPILVFGKCPNNGHRPYEQWDENPRMHAYQRELHNSVSNKHHMEIFLGGQGINMP